MHLFVAKRGLFVSFVFLQRFVNGNENKGPRHQNCNYHRSVNT